MKNFQFEKINILISEEKKIIKEFDKLNFDLEKALPEEKTMIQKQLELINKKLKETNVKLKTAFSEILFSKALEIEKKPLKTSVIPQIPKKVEEGVGNEKKENLKSKGGKIFSLKEISSVGLEKETIKKIRDKKKKQTEKKIVDKSEYSKIASEFFSKTSRKLLGQNSFKKMEKQLIKGNLNYTPVGYVSIIIMTTLISFIVGGFLFLFFLFFNFGATLPIITRAADPVNIRFLKVFWILLAVPISTFLFMFVYPSIERQSAEESINAELPFATIHMSAISGSMVNPIKIFEIIISTKEYPALTKEFTKLINEINLYGYDMVSALKNTAKNSPSKRLAELLNGLATTINSGGNLAKFFEKRAQTFLFDYKLQQQKASRAAETFMDMYISIVIAAPMILMLLMMIMKMSGLGITLSVGGIALLTILGVVVINIIFMAFLYIRKK